jgi:hypothetical protein
LDARVFTPIHVVFEWNEMEFILISLQSTSTTHVD